MCSNHVFFRMAVNLNNQSQSSYEQMQWVTSAGWNYCRRIVETPDWMVTCAKPISDHLGDLAPCVEKKTLVPTTRNKI